MSEEAPRHRVSLRARRIIRRILIVLIVISMVGFLGFKLYLRHLDGNLDRKGFDNTDGRPEKTVGLNVLVMGSDTREGANGAGIGGETPGLSDTTMLLHLSANRKFAYGISLPRDAIVDRPRCKKDDGTFAPAAPATQFNAAYAVAGPSCTVKTVEKLTGVHIDHFIVVDFVGFRKMVNAIGGVKICVPEAINDDVGNISLPAGTYKVTGQQALDYVRVRHDIGDGSDVGRMRRQQAFVSAMIKKVVSAGTIADPTKLFPFVEAATKSLTVDTATNIDLLMSIGSQLKDIGLNKVNFITVPIEPYAPDPNRLVWAPSAAGLWKLVLDDKNIGPRFNADALSPGQGEESPSSTPTGTPSSTPTATAEQIQAAKDAKDLRDGLCPASQR